MTFRIERVEEALPIGFGELAEEARRGGYRMLDRLAAEWQAGEARFDRGGEVLLAAFLDERLIGIGGMTLDPDIPEAVRMRRFYVAKAARQRGIGRQLALFLLGRPEMRDRLVTVNAAAGSEKFWAALGFIPDCRDGHTHLLLPPTAAPRQSR